MKPAPWLPALLVPLWLILAAPTRVAQAAPAAPAPATLPTRIGAIIDQPRYAHADWGIAVISLDRDRILYAHHADRLFEPASTAKLFTAVLTLDTLGATRQLPTRLLSAAPIRAGTLQGPLLLRGGGDPTLGTPAANHDWADDLAAQLAARGIRTIGGDLIADTRLFTGPALGSGWEASDLLGWFAAPASALSVHENTVTLTVTPAATADQPAMLSFAPAVAAPPVRGLIATTPARGVDDINLYRALGERDLHAFGSIAAGTPPRSYRLAIPDPARQAGEELHAALVRHDIHLDGQVRVLRWPQDDADLHVDTPTLAQVQSPPLAAILEQGLKRSQNLYLQNLLQLDGVAAQAASAGQPDASTGFLSSEAWGLHALDGLLGRIGIDPATVQLEEGTGLARADLITPTALVQLLRYAATQPWGERLRTMLPIAGTDGTLQYRLRELPAADNAHAKTGSMTHVHTLAGYVTAANGERLAFAIMLNRAVRAPGAPPATHDIDAIVQLLASYRG